MTALAPEKAVPGTQPVAAESCELFDLLDRLDLPRGYRAEIVEGSTITVSPVASGRHQRTVRSLDLQLRPHLPAGHDAEPHLEIRMPDLGRSVIPDLFVAPVEVLNTADSVVPPDDVLLVAEVVSPGNARSDRVVKLEVYAKAAIEFYLLIDPIAGQTTLFSNPSAGRYQDRVTRDFGEKLVVPEPFGFDLDTSQFPSLS
ncbi:Uma2 family endonuclease [Marinitenerispora sediminis]|uniref:Uma2 family endonuclease n=2 Tax=Marinitenerispora sediminis TaxID=1931232 RepID=A0A368T7C6_9ACTN|nr:Uma2 family endonuclease [Marinitenerispora sediminis]RCV57634.1 Uma2 family endonuclease [Marinitenerispora sediminis]RCV59941.1 Uma2 family endonuclease [Marinitenerispora sediminis]